MATAPMQFRTMLACRVLVVLLALTWVCRPACAAEDSETGTPTAESAGVSSPTELPTIPASEDPNPEAGEASHVPAAAGHVDVEKLRAAVRGLQTAVTELRSAVDVLDKIAANGGDASSDELVASDDGPRDTFAAIIDGVQTAVTDFRKESKSESSAPLRDVARAIKDANSSSYRDPDSLRKAVKGAVSKAIRDFHDLDDQKLANAKYAELIQDLQPQTATVAEWNEFYDQVAEVLYQATSPTSESATPAEMQDAWSSLPENLRKDLFHFSKSSGETYRSNVKAYAAAIKTGVLDRAYNQGELAKIKNDARTTTDQFIAVSIVNAKSRALWKEAYGVWEKQADAEATTIEAWKAAVVALLKTLEKSAGTYIAWLDSAAKPSSPGKVSPAASSSVGSTYRGSAWFWGCRRHHQAHWGY